jgi:SpoVK/Ycf46/Vps4 family AAA+-type ATPase
MVTISETKSMWYGQSEKLIKDVFDQYRRQAEKSEITPILLFNEADGVFSSRKQIGHSNVDQTENAIQNIILQEMEDLEGILIATTNLTQNLDKAFERRFLYKIRFDKPDFKNRIRIWKDRIDGLTPPELRTLAGKYEFTGGQIDNIARKLLMQKVLYGLTDVVKLEKFCEEENLDGSNQKRIGYR